MPSFVYPGLSDEEKEHREKCIRDSAQPKTVVDNGDPAHKQEAAKAMQKAEVEAIVEGELEAIKAIDAVRTIGKLVFPKGEAVTVNDKHPLLKKLNTLADLGTLERVERGMKKSALPPKGK